MTTTSGTVAYTYEREASPKRSGGGAANRLTSVGEVSYTYDDNGNLTSDGTYTYTWNVAGRLIKVEDITTTIVYTYNGDGVRVAQEIDGQLTRWVQDTIGLAQVLVEVAEGPSTLYLYGLGRLAQVEDTDREWFLGDALGSLRQLVDDDGEVVLARDYEPYGQVLSESGTASSGYGFTGEQYPRYIDMVFLRARWYSVRGGRFVSQDPWPGSIYRPTTLHKYIYAANNPILYNVL
jgi:RHS repeat-associated protein